MNRMEFVIKWVTDISGKTAKPKVYFFRNGKPRRQLTVEEVRFYVSTGAIADVLVAGWVRKQAESKVLKESLAGFGRNGGPSAQPTPAIVREINTEEVPTEFKPNSRELYDYLDGMYKKTNFFNV